jgi:hypothetical protein
MFKKKREREREKITVIETYYSITLDTISEVCIILSRQL